MSAENNFDNLDCTILIKTLKNRRYWLNSALEIYDRIYKGLKIAIVETADAPNPDLKRFKNLKIIYKCGQDYSCEGALYELSKLADTKYIIEQGDDDLILVQRLSFLIEIAKISKCEIVSFESLMINELDRELYCKNLNKSKIFKSFNLSKLAIKRGLYQSAPESSVFLSKRKRLEKFNKKYMMTAFSIIEREVAKRVHTSEWISPYNGIGERTASLHAYVGFKTIRVPIIAYLRLVTMSELSPAAKERGNLFSSDIAKKYAINYFKISAPYLKLNNSDLNMSVLNRKNRINQNKLQRTFTLFKIRIHKVLVSLLNIFLPFF